MSVPLEYPNKCARCGVLMAAGTPVEFFKEGSSYVYLHVGDCDEAVASAKPVRFRKRFDCRECSRFECHYATGVAFPAGSAPPRCPLCNSLWLVEVLT